MDDLAENQRVDRAILKTYSRAAGASYAVATAPPARRSRLTMNCPFAKVFGFGGLIQADGHLVFTTRARKPEGRTCSERSG